MDNFVSNYQQFCLDLPRLKLFLEGEECNKNPLFVKDYFFDHFEPHIAKICIFLLTQTFLADFYIMEYRKTTDPNEHLLDNGDYIVWVDTQRKTLNLQKDFKKVSLLEDEPYLLDLVSLHIYLNLETKILNYGWIYDIGDSEAPIMVYDFEG